MIGIRSSCWLGSQKGSSDTVGTGFLCTVKEAAVCDMGLTNGPDDVLAELKRFDGLSTSHPVPGDGRKRSGYGMAMRLEMSIS